jgi:AraC family transcriptional activator of pobA
MHEENQCLHNSNMSRSGPSSIVSRLPTYALYGESSGTFGVDWLHCESIAERSRLHQWEIRPHRRDRLFQILYVHHGRTQVEAEGAGTVLRGPCVVTVPAPAVHGFAFSRDVDGVVFTIVEQHLKQLLQGEPALRARMLRLRCECLGPSVAARVHEAALSLRDEHAATGPWRTLAIDAALLRLVVELQRALPEAPAESAGWRGGRAIEQVQRFRGLVERRYREQPALADCARELGITPTQLNRLCRQVLGRTALDVMHARTVLEAQRELAYTTLTVKQIGLGLGFADSGYFTRFFRRETGATPTSWRAAVRTD